MDKRKILSKQELFKNLTENELDDLSDISNIRNYPKNSFVFWQDEPITNVYIIAKGLVKIYRTYPFGKVKTIDLKNENDILSELSLLLPFSHFTTAQVLSDSVIICFSIKQYAEITKNNEGFNKEIKTSSHKKIRNYMIEIGNSIYKNINGNLAIKLIQLADKFGSRQENGTVKIKLKLSQQELADMVGTNRETVCKSLLAFKAEKSISIKNKLITILDKGKLEKWE